MEAKEGIVLDRDGTPIAGTGPQGGYGEGAHGSARVVRVFRGGWGLALLLGILVPLMVVAGVFVLAIVVAVMLVAWILRMLFSTSRR
jgi:hypothetical protein